MQQRTISTGYEKIPTVGPLITPPSFDDLNDDNNDNNDTNNVRSVTVYGGESKGKQMRTMERLNPQVIIGTPGRLTDFCHMGKINLSRTCVLILDEASFLFVDCYLSVTSRNKFDHNYKEQVVIQSS